MKIEKKNKIYNMYVEIKIYINQVQLNLKVQFFIIIINYK